MAWSVSDLGTVQDAGSDNQSNFSFGSFGAEASDRDLIAVIATRDSANVYTASSITIGGVAASIVQTGAANTRTTAIVARARVPTGSSGSVVVNWSESITQDQVCTLLRGTGGSDAAASDSSINDGSAFDTSIATAADLAWGAGDLVVGGVAFVASGGATWSGLSTEDEDLITADGFTAFSAAHEVKGSAASGQSISCSFSSAQQRSIAVAVFAVAAEPPTGTGTGTLQALTGSASGLATVTGTAAGTTAAATGSASGVHGVTGTAAGALPALTGSGTGLTTVTGTGAGTTPTLTGSAAGVHGVVGTAAGTTTATTGSASGVHGVAGAAAGTTEATTGSGSGAHGVAGVAASETSAATGSGSGAHGVAGSAAGTLGTTTGSGAGEFGEEAAEGTGSGTLPSATGSGSGAIGALGGAGGSLPGATGDGSGEVEGGEEVTPPVRQVGLAIPIRPRKRKPKLVAGKAAGQLPALAGEAEGAHGSASYIPRGKRGRSDWARIPPQARRAQAIALLPALGGAAVAYLPPAGPGAGALPMPTAAITARFDHHSDEELAVIAATLAA